MLGKLNKEVFYCHPPERVWQAITNRRILAAWLMENDFEPRIGCKFSFYSQSLPGIDTNIRCEVIEIDEPNRLVYTWQDWMMSQPSIVSWTLKAVEGGTRLRLEHRMRETALTASRQPVYSPDLQNRLIPQSNFMPAQPKASPSFILASYLNYGENDPLNRLSPYLKRMDDSRDAIVFLDMIAKWRGSYGYVENMGYAIALAVTNERAKGRIYNVGKQKILSEAERVTKIGELAGWKGNEKNKPVIKRRSNATSLHYFPAFFK